MKTDYITLSAVIIGTILILWQIMQIRVTSGQKFLKTGDVVIYTDPTGCVTEKNVLTQVIAVFDTCKTAQIRFGSTSAVVHLRDLQLIKLDRNYPITIFKGPGLEVSVTNVA